MMLEKEVERICKALDGSGGVQRQRIATIGIKWLDLLLRKNADYGDSVFRPSILAPDLPPATSILVRMSDKIERIHNHLNGHAHQVKDESALNDISDLGSYALLYLAVQNADKAVQDKRVNSEADS